APLPPAHDLGPRGRGVRVAAAQPQRRDPDALGAGRHGGPYLPCDPGRGAGRRRDAGGGSSISGRAARESAPGRRRNMDRNRMIARSGVAHAATFALAIAFAGLVGCEPQTREPPIDQLPGTGAEPAAEVAPGVDTALGTETNTTAAQQVVTI